MSIPWSPKNTEEDSNGQFARKFVAGLPARFSCQHNPGDPRASSDGSKIDDCATRYVVSMMLKVHRHKFVPRSTSDLHGESKQALPSTTLSRKSKRRKVTHVLLDSIQRWIFNGPVLIIHEILFFWLIDVMAVEALPKSAFFLGGGKVLSFRVEEAFYKASFPHWKFLSYTIHGGDHKLNPPRVSSTLP